MCEVAVSAMREHELIEFIRTRKTFKDCVEALERLSKIDYNKYSKAWVSEIEKNFKDNKPVIL